MKAVLVALNAKYIHSNLGVYCLYAYSRKKGISSDELVYREFTINQEMDDILGALYKEKPDLIGFSCYIWNIEEIKEMARELHTRSCRIPQSGLADRKSVMMPAKF